ncbi:hypothetical protein ACIG0D_06875 [Streptomyces sp. NPDC052773]|uniref:hypothetical protein n=1 Tax=Streptomyces sp. NPDC052773 TaxID=3365693 RepID=UPI0037D8304C
MRGSTIRAGRAAALVVGAILATACGEGAGPPAGSAAASPTPSPPSAKSFGRHGVLKDLRAAVAAAGSAEGKVELGFGVSPQRLDRAGPEKERKVAALMTRLAPCTVGWTPAETRYGSPGAVDPATTRRQLDAVLSGLAARGWKATASPRETPLGNDGTYFMASYEKHGWFLHARHAQAPALDHMTVMATEEACYARLTDEERALIED